MWPKFLTLKTTATVNAEAVAAARERRKRVEPVNVRYGIDNVINARFVEAERFATAAQKFVNDVEDWLGPEFKRYLTDYNPTHNAENADGADPRALKRLGFKWRTTGYRGTPVHLGYVVTNHPNDGWRCDFLSSTEHITTSERNSDIWYEAINDSGTLASKKHIKYSEESLSAARNFPTYEEWKAASGNVPEWFKASLRTMAQMKDRH